MTGLAGWSATCGCRQTRLMAPAKDVWIEYVRCAKHYQAKRDDPLILAAARARRKFEAKLRS